MSSQKEAVGQQVRLLQAQAAEEVEANQAGMILCKAFDRGWIITYSSLGPVEWRSNRVCRVCKAHGPTATGGPRTPQSYIFVHTNTGSI